MKPPTLAGTLVTRHELAEMFGVTRAGARYIGERDDFPAPIDVCRDGREPIWWRDSVEDWAYAREQRITTKGEA